VTALSVAALCGALLTRSLDAVAQNATDDDDEDSQVASPPPPTRAPVFDDERLPDTPPPRPRIREATVASEDDTPPRREPADAQPFHRYQAPRNAGWVEPVWPIVGLVSGYYQTNFGYSHSLSRGLDLNASFGFGSYNHWSGRHTTGGASVGLTVFVTGREAMNGLFFAPKLAFSVLYDSRTSGDAVYFGPGLDIGYQFTYGGFFIAPVVGVEWDAVFPLTTSNPIAYATRINLAGFRIGWTFDGAVGSRGERQRALRLASHRDRGFDLARDHRPRTVAFWTTPVWMAIGPFFNRYNVDLGATVAIVDRLQLVIEGAWEWGALQNGVTFQQANYSRADVAIGTAIMLVRTGGLTGLFLQPKLYADVWIPGAVGGLAPAFGGGFGLDIGWAFQAGPLYIAPVIGFRLGGLAVAQPGVSERQQPTGFAPEFNAQVMRLGFAL
jgi:hypothetical protein